jgi:hypothetical protein
MINLLPVLSCGSPFSAEIGPLDHLYPNSTAPTVEVLQLVKASHLHFIVQVKRMHVKIHIHCINTIQIRYIQRTGRRFIQYVK